MKYSEEKGKKTVAVCMSRFNGNYQMAFVKSFVNDCRKHDISMFIFSSLADFHGEYDIEAETKIYDLIRPEKYDAVVILSDSFRRPEIARNIAERVVAAGVPCISLLSDMKDCINMNFTFAGSFEKVVRHVVEYHKPENINFMAGIKGNPYAEERLEVFKRVMAENGRKVETDRIGYGDFWEVPTSRAMDAFLISGKKIDAIICANDFMAMEVCKKLRAVGLSVPEDVIVSGFDGIELEKFHYPRLTTVLHDTEKLTKTLAEIINALCEGESVSSSYEIECLFTPGQSCGCVSKEVADIPSFGIKSFEAHRKVRDRENNIEMLYENLSPLGNKTGFENVWEKIYYFGQRFFDEDFVLAINEDFLNPDMELWPTLNAYSKNGEGGHFSENMRMAVRNRDGLFSKGGTFPTEELYPDIDSVFEDDKPIMFMPLHIQGNTIGYASIRFEPEDLDYFMMYAYLKHVAQIIELQKARLDETILFSTDHLTGLLNRKGFYNQMVTIMERAVRNQEKMTVISIDMNGLKEINDTYGHKEGDYALSTVGRIFMESVKEDCVVTRLGGDEFAIAYINEGGEDEAAELMHNIRLKMQAFNETGEKTYKLEAGMGAVTAVPASSESLERLLTEADKKMYKNKTMLKKRAKE